MTRPQKFASGEKVLKKVTIYFSDSAPRKTSKRWEAVMTSEMKAAVDSVEAKLNAVVRNVNVNINVNVNVNVNGNGEKCKWELEM